MDDLDELLNATMAALDSYGFTRAAETLERASTEIERLRAEVQRLREAAKRVIAAQSGSAFSVNESINELRRVLEGE
jgi:uncharacterized protein (UPF0335 family)